MTKYKIKLFTILIVPFALRSAAPTINYQMVYDEVASSDDIDKLIDKIKKEFPNGIPIKYSSYDAKMTPLHDAARLGHIAVVKALIKAKKIIINIDCRNLNGWTPLHFAVFEGHTDVINSLILAKATIDARDNLDSTPLSIAALNEEPKLVDLLLNAGANPELIKPTFFESEINNIFENYKKYRQSILIELPKYFIEKFDQIKFVPKISELIIQYLYLEETQYDRMFSDGVKSNNEYRAIQAWQNGANVKRYLNCPLLHISVKNQSIYLIKKLIINGFDVNSRNADQCTPLHIAANQSNLEIIKILIYFKAAVNAVDFTQSTALHYAAKIGVHKVINELISANADINAKDNKQNTALHMATIRNYNYAIKELVDAKADINAKNNLGLTALHYAIIEEDYFFDDLKIVDLLIKAGANCNAQDKDDMTPTHYAAGELQVIKKLIDAKANLFLNNNRQENAIHVAINNGKAQSVIYMLKNSENNKYKDLLFYAIDRNHEYVVIELLDFGADLQFIVNNIYEINMRSYKKNRMREIISGFINDRKAMPQILKKNLLMSRAVLNIILSYIDESLEITKEDSIIKNKKKCRCIIM